MKVIRRLCLRGNALYVSIPKAMAAQLHWRGGDSLTVEAIGAGAVRIRPIDVTDLTSAPVPPLNFDLPRTITK
jgi:antitoxin component of MazEF toxin-antitoxin module